MQEVARKPNKADVYNEFILWTAMPHQERVRLGIEWQYQFEDFYSVNGSTLTRWKERIDFEQRVDKILKMWSTDMTPAVVHSIYRTAIKGNPMSQLLWLQYFKGFNPKPKDEERKMVEIGVNDIRFLIESIPEPTRTKFYGYLREIIDTAVALRRAGEMENRPLPNEEPERALLGEANNDASNVQRAETNDIPASDQGRIRKDMVREIYAYHHQGAPWWWQEQAPRHSWI